MITFLILKTICIIGIVIYSLDIVIETLYFLTNKIKILQISSKVILLGFIVGAFYFLQHYQIT